MKKIVKQITAVCVSLVMAISVACISVSAEEVPIQESTIIVDLTKGEKVFIDESQFDLINTAARGVSLPYVGGIAFASTVTVYSPIFSVSFPTNAPLLKFAPYNFVGDKKIDLTLYTHTIYDQANEYTMNDLGKLTFNSVVSCRLLLNGTVNSHIDKIYLGFTPHDDCASSFDYTLSFYGN